MLRLCSLVCVSLCAVVSPFFPAAASAADSPPAAFAFDALIDLATALAKQKYADPADLLPDKLGALTREQWDKITFHKEAMLWDGGDSPFAIGFHHSGFIYNQSVAINIIDEGKALPVLFSADDFEYPDDETREAAANAGIGFAGFHMKVNIPSGDTGGESPDNGDLISFLGRSFFRARARHSGYGVYARGLAVDTALADGEELPYFREFWIEKPRPGDTALSVYALLDSPRLTGAFHMLVSPGTSTIMDVRAKLFGRDGAGVPQKIGFAPLTGMFLHSEIGGNRTGDYRPEVHDSDGLLFAGDNGEWNWRPLFNPVNLDVSKFDLESPRGFGLLQRDDNFDHYQDLEGRFERRPSVWVEPLGNWGAGHVELVEIPANADHQANIVAFWVSDSPANGKPASAEAKETPSVPSPLADIKYRLYWMTPGASPHDLGRAAATRIQRSASDNTIQFIIDFEGEQLNSLGADTGLVSIVDIPEHFAIAEKRLQKNEVTSGWRLVLKIKLPPEKGILDSLFSSRGSYGPTRFRAFLKLGENLPDPLTETWVFDLQPVNGNLK